jgi:hypothetical protein
VIQTVWNVLMAVPNAQNAIKEVIYKAIPALNNAELV